VEVIAIKQKAAKQNVSGIVEIPLANHQLYDPVIKSITKASCIKAASLVIHAKINRSL
jgi:hypothetical protein